MGNALSNVSEASRARNVMSENGTMEESGSKESEEEYHDTIDLDEARAKAKEEEMDEFKKQLNIKREQRREILDRHKAEKKNLESAVDVERKAKLETYETNRQLRELLMRNNIEIPKKLQSCKEDGDISETISSMREEFETLRTHNIKLRRGLAEANSSLQEAYSDIADLQSQNTESIKHVNALKEVVTVSKTMIHLREQQLNELKNKLGEIERSLSDREASMLSTDLRNEYVKQLQNIRTLRALYEERARLAEVTKQGLMRDLDEQKVLKQAETDRCDELKVKVETLETKVEDLLETIDDKNNKIFSCQEEARGLNAEMLAVNKLFSQVLLGYKNKKDLDKLVHRLEENHGLLTSMAEKENGSEASSALPKLLLELVSQVDDGDEEKISDDGNKNHELEAKEDCLYESAESQNTSAEEIVQNLPKVWRVLIELLSHQTTPDENAADKVTTCYKSVETKSGPVLVPSVSQTYIRLKDLIIEKLTLIKEVNRMKQLNSHLEMRLGEQEKRLGLVTNELSKTWHVVGRLRRHHHQLHTHEKILKYELQQKRKLLNELKEELAYCREKWEQAREKNTQTEKDWRKLRAEFTSRKSKPCASFNNSAESGYSDERPSDESSESNDESEHVTEPFIRRSKKKIKKSFETILDSSADFNLAAEREDPPSDMIDVADLPLDSHEAEDNNEISDSCNSESLLKSERLNEETEDEIADEIANDSCQEESFVAEIINSELINSDNSKNDQNKEDIRITVTKSTPSTINASNTVIIDPAAILKSIKEQNERLALKDKKLEKLERSGAALLNQTQITNKISKEISNTLDHLLSRPTTSRQNHEIINKHDKVCLNDIKTESETVISEIKPSYFGVNRESDVASSSVVDSITTVTLKTDEVISKGRGLDEDDKNTDFGAILESIKVQNERLARKEERLQNLEQGCSSVVEAISNTLNSSEGIIQKLDALHNDAESTLQTEEENKVEDGIDVSDSEPSTSNYKHEARFAARDIRLKRLEEQTKSLVNKVIDTTSKGVKIDYKLEELHNIYGSEGSRAGTPSDIEEKSQNNTDEMDDP